VIFDRGGSRQAENGNDIGSLRCVFGDLYEMVAAGVPTAVIGNWFHWSGADDWYNIADRYLRTKVTLCSQAWRAEHICT
jgi:hypothetical protein